MMSPTLSKKNIPRQEILVVIRSLVFENLHGFIALESGIVDSSDKSTQG
jgi:hypothetical protein